MIAKAIVGKDAFDKSMRLFTNEEERRKHLTKYTDRDIEVFGLKMVRAILITDPPTLKDAEELRRIAQTIERGVFE